MRDVNKVILVGRLGTDPVKRSTHNGITVVHFSMATSRRSKSEEAGSGDWVEETQWHRVVAWGRQGENCAQYLKKGQSVFVEGSIRTRKFDGRDGAERMAFEVHAEKVSFLGRSSRLDLHPSLEAHAELPENSDVIN